MNSKEKIINSDKDKVLLFFIISCGILIRVFMAYWHFTHVDDVGVLVQYLLQNQGTNEINQGMALARNWTYAPLQGIFTSLLVNKTFSYRLNVFMSRIPSCLFGIAAIFVFYKILRKMAFEKTKYLLPLFCALLCFSWENIIYSAQAEPYEIVVFWGYVIILSAFQKFYESWKKSFFYLVVFSFGCYAHYQFFILIFSYYLALFVCNLREKNNLIRICTISFGNLLLSLPILKLFFTLNRLKNGLNWNRGLGDQFFLTLSSEHLVNNIKHFFKFFTCNTFYVFKYFFTIDSFDILSTVLAIILLSFAFVGFFYLHKKNLLLALYSDFVIFIVVVLVTKQKLTFGPSRHILFIYPMFMIFLCYGVLFLRDIFSSIFVQKQIIPIKIILVALCSSFLFSLLREIGNRKNLLSEKELNKLAKEYSPDFIYGTAWTPDICAMEIDGYSEEFYWIDRGLQKKTAHPLRSNKYLIINRCISIENLFSRKNDRFFYHLESHEEKFKEANFSDFNVIYKKEISLPTEIEYAQKYFNYPNGLCLYVIESIEE